MTPARETSSVTEMTRRGEAYGLPSVRIDGNDVEQVYATVEEAVARARAGGGPTFIEAMTYRLWGHMMGDPEVYRKKEEVAAAREVEPIVCLGRRLRDLGHSEAELTALESEADAVIAAAVEFAQASPLATAAGAVGDVFA